MNKIIASLFLSFGLLLLTSTSVKAALVTVEKNGLVQVNVLAAQDSLALTIPKREDLEIKDIALSVDEGVPSIYLTKTGETVQLKVKTDNEEKSLDVTNFSGDVIEIEERGEVQKIKIYVKDKKFVLSQGGIQVSTDFPVNINPESAEISVKTDSGVKYLSLLPKDATEVLLRSKTLTNIPTDSKVNLIEENGVVVYEITGVKKVNLFNVADYNFDVSSKVSASNGEVVSTNEPIWLKLMSLFLN
jgi:hypothetical protein